MPFDSKYTRSLAFNCFPPKFYMIEENLPGRYVFGRITTKYPSYPVPICHYFHKKILHILYNLISIGQ